MQNGRTLCDYLKQCDKSGYKNERRKEGREEEREGGRKKKNVKAILAILFFLSVTQS